MNLFRIISRRGPTPPVPATEASRCCSRQPDRSTVHCAPPPLLAEASKWLVRLLDRDPDPSDSDFDRAARSAAFSKWVSRSDEHKAAFLLVCRTHQQMGALRSHSRRDSGALLTGCTEQRPTTERPKARRRWQTVAASLGVLALGSLGYHEQQKTRIPAQVLTGTFATRLGEHRCEKLPDGSDICLDTRSTVRFTYAHNTRNVELVSGQASFAIQKDERPFEVLAGGLLIHDVSTAFDVYKKGDSTLVTVIDGRVKVAPSNANPGWETAPEFHRLQQVEFDETTGTLRARPTLTESGLFQVLAWKQGRIDLNGLRLVEVLEELARYQPIARFTFQDKSLRELRLGGDMEATRLSDLLEYLKVQHGVRYTFSRDSDGQIVVHLSRRQADPGRPGS
jgi:transmembrane sensor